MLNNVDADVFESPLCESMSNAGNVYSGDPMTGVIAVNYVYDKPESLFAIDDNIGEDNDVHDSTPNMFPAIKLFRKTHTQNFKFVHVNIDSYKLKLVPIQEILQGRVVDLLFIS